MVRFRTLSAATLMACSLAPALAQNQPLDVRTGLWEVTTQRATAGMPEMPKMPSLPPEVLAKMPPAQRAQIEAALKARSNMGSGERVHKVCISDETLRKGPAFDLPPRDANCKRTRNVRTERGWQLREVCRRNGRKQTMDIDYEAVNREIIKGTVNIAMRDGARAITMKQTSNGRWLGPDCGDVKPND